MRQAFSETLIKLASEDDRVLLLTGDHGYALFDEFRKVLPDQYINAGIAEQNMVGMAAGLAKMGLRPIVYGLSAFVPVRVVEQIKIDVAHDNLPVLLMGDGAGLVYSHLGTTHQSLEDIAVLRSLPNMQIYSPADRFELQACMEHSFKSSQPTYIRMGKSDLGEVHAEPCDISYPIAVAGQEGVGEAVFYATGSMVKTAFLVAKAIDAVSTVYSVPRIHPLCSSTLTAQCAHASRVVTFEEHSIFGGLGSAVCESLSSSEPKRVLRIGSHNTFSKTCGTYSHLLAEHHLDFVSVMDKVSVFLK
jgi:transketolase